jgi:urocanate hydratase
VPAPDKIAASLSGKPPMPASRLDSDPQIRAPRGSELSCRSWLTEAAYRMLQNNLDDEVAENPQALVVYGGIGRAARDWDCYDAILATLRTLGDDETLLVQSGKPVGVFPSHPTRRACCSPTPTWCRTGRPGALQRARSQGPDDVRADDAGCWIYIGSQGIVQGTYETFVEMGRQHHGGNLDGKWILTAGLGGMGGAQPLAASLAGACSLNIECRSRASTCACARVTSTSRPPTSTTRWRASRVHRRGKAISIALLGNARRSCPSSCAAACARRAHRPDLRARSAARLPAEGWTLEAVAGTPAIRSGARGGGSESFHARAREAMLALQQQGVRPSTTATTSARWPSTSAARMPSTSPASCPRTCARCSAAASVPFRWVALSGDPEDIYKTDAKVKELLPTTSTCTLARHGKERISFQGLPARICWVGLGDRHRLALAFNEMVAKGELKAPIVIGRDHWIPAPSLRRTARRKR